MTCKPDRRYLAALLVVVAASGGALGGGALLAAPGEDAIAEARAAIERGDGIAAEMAGKRALEQGSQRFQVAALIGEAELLQGDLDDARDWLGDMRFDAATRQQGLHALARLELAQDNLAAAAQAFDQMLQSGPPTALVWVDIGRMRYLAGEQHAALDAARFAVQIDPQEPRALEFMAMLVRDAQGINAALPLFRDALAIAPTDVGLLAQYGVSLGDAGQNADMLSVARRINELDSSEPRAFFMQAVLAARTGKDDLARRLMWRMGETGQAMPSAMMLSAILEYRVGNYASAVEQFDQLLRRQPLNETVQLMLGRALLASGDAREAADMLEARANASGASPYLLTLMGRACEQLGKRDRAAAYLDRAANQNPRLSPQLLTAQPAFLPMDSASRIRAEGDPVIALRQLLGEGRAAEARSMVDGLLAQFPSSINLQLLSADVDLLAGNASSALSQYRRAAEVRSDWPLMQRITAAMLMMDDQVGARRQIARYVAANPQAGDAVAMLGRMQRDAGNPARATMLLRHAVQLGAGRSDPLLLAELAEMELLLGDPDQALIHARSAHYQQRANRRVAGVLARVYAMREGDGGPALALAAKARGVGTAVLASN